MRRPCGLMDRASASGSCRRSRRAAARRDSSPPSLRRGGLRGASRRFTVRLRARSSLLDIMHFFFPFSGQGRGAGGRVLRRRDAAGQGCPLPAAFNFGRAHPSSRARGGGGSGEHEGAVEAEHEGTVGIICSATRNRRSPVSDSHLGIQRYITGVPDFRSLDPHFIVLARQRCQKKCRNKI